MFLTDLFKLNKACLHDKIKPNVNRAYCPDCGKLVENEWYITRCACCGVKLQTMAKNGNVQPQHHYCTNCGSREYTIEKLEQINFIDINFAVLIKNEVESNNNIFSTTQCWQEKTVELPKLPKLFL